jgi:hypothetical protein
VLDTLQSIGKLSKKLNLVGQTIVFCRLLPRACGPRNFMKNSAEWQNGKTATARSE